MLLRVIIYFFLVAVVLLAVRGGLWAQEPAGDGGIQNVPSGSFSGEVLRREGQSLTVETDSGTKTVSVPGNIAIERNGLAAGIDDIRPGDRVTVRESNGRVLAVEAIAGGVVDWTKYAIPIAAGILLMLGILYWFWRRGKEPHIKTTMDRNL